MILVDCGNSSIKAQYRVGNALIASYRGRYGDSWEDRFSRWLECLSSTHCYLSSVLDPVRQQQLDACLRLKFDSGVTRFSAQFESLGITNGYQEPERLGVDRWLALIGAAGITRQNCFVIDAGSAITIDLLGSDGRHLGGAILPGVNTSIEAFKAIFKAIDFSNPSIAKNRQPGCSTEAAIQIDYAQDSLSHVTTLLNRWTELFDEKPGVLLTGGEVARIQQLPGYHWSIIPDLVFQGMNRLIKRQL